MRVKETLDGKLGISINVEKEHLQALESHPLKRAVGKSGLIRIAISEFLERQKLEKVEKNKILKGER